MFERTLAIGENLSKPDEHQTADAMWGIATALNKLGRHDEALEMNHKAHRSL